MTSQTSINAILNSKHYKEGSRITRGLAQSLISTPGGGLCTEQFANEVLKRLYGIGKLEKHSSGGYVRPPRNHTSWRKKTNTKLKVPEPHIFGSLSEVHLEAHRA